MAQPCVDRTGTDDLNGATILETTSYDTTPRRLQNISQQRRYADECEADLEGAGSDLRAGKGREAAKKQKSAAKKQKSASKSSDSDSIDRINIDSKAANEFKHLWEPRELTVLRDTMTYDGNERLIQKAYEEGWTDAEAREKGIASGLEGWSRNDRGELMVYDSKFGWTVVVPHQREDIFRALARWLHAQCFMP